MLDVITNVFPDEVAASIRSGSLREFVAAYGSTSFLLVKLDQSSFELQVGLAELDSAGRAAANPNVIGFHTVVMDVEELAPEPAAGDQGVSEIRRRLAAAPHFAITIEKRVHGSTYMDRIAVGRARNQDLVLRHASVSKSHAWFERDASGALFVADAGSRNGTRINQNPTARRELTAVHPGDVLHFGHIEAVLCSAETLWRAAARR